MALDVIFLTDGSTRSVTNFNKHKERFPYAKKFVTTLTGIQAYKAALKLSNTTNFYIIDHDFIVSDDFDFSFVPEEFDRGYVHAWRHDQVIGTPLAGFMLDYGGVFLFQKSALRHAGDDLQDVGEGVKYMDCIASKLAPLDIVIASIDGARPERLIEYISQFAIPKVVKADTYAEAFEKANEVAETENYYVVDATYTLPTFTFEFRPFDYDASYVHVWHRMEEDGKINPGGVHLMNRSHFTSQEYQYDFGDDVKFNDAVVSFFNSTDTSIVFLSYDEPNAEKNWNALVKRFPYAKRVHGVEGILNAHKKAAELSSTSSFFVVDGDSEVLDTFDFDVKFSKYDRRHYVHIWKCLNPVNGLTYGYGGVKMFHKEMFENFDETIVDMSTLLGDGVKLIDEVATITHFNSDPFHAFRGAFREGTKLSSGIIKNQNAAESIQRLNTWCTKAEGAFAEDVLAGANLGEEFGIKYASDVEQLQVINKFSEIYKIYRKYKMEAKQKEMLEGKFDKIGIKTITNLTNMLYQPEIFLSLNEVRDMLSRDELMSKFWLIDELNKVKPNEKLNALVIEGGTGLLGNFMFQFYEGEISKIYSTVSDKRFERISDLMNIDKVIDGWQFKTFAQNPYTMYYEDTKLTVDERSTSFDWNVLIAPHCELLYDVYDMSRRIPKGKIVIAQSNTFGDMRTSVDHFEDFKKRLDLGEVLYTGTYPGQVYDRHMIIGIK